MQASDQQLQVFDWHKNNVGVTSGALLINAGAGTGKTTTLVECSNNYIPDDISATFLAFGKDIATVMQERMPTRKVSTFHSMGLGGIRRVFKGVDVKPYKDDMILETILNKYTHKWAYYPISKLASAVRNTMSEPTDEALRDLATEYNIDLNGESNLMFDSCRKLLKIGLDMTSVVSYDDMIYMPVKLGIDIPQYDYVAVDERQDLNITQNLLVEKALKPGGNIVAVGDRFQSIFGWRGADLESMSKFVSTFNADELPLSLTYRCPKSVVRLVNQTFPHIRFEAPDWAIEGDILTQDFYKCEFIPGDMVLCRTNAPLVNPCYSLIRRGIKAIIKGRDIGQGLVSLVKRMKAKDLKSLMDRLEDYLNQETYKLLAQNKELAAQSLTDRIETIYSVISNVSLNATVDDVIATIQSIFSDDNAAVTLSSIHRAKGLEADRVFILKPELMPHPMAKKDSEKQQEDNLRYVAYTRAKKELVFVTGVK